MAITFIARSACARSTGTRASSPSGSRWPRSSTPPGNRGNPTDAAGALVEFIDADDRHRVLGAVGAGAAHGRAEEDPASIARRGRAGPADCGGGAPGQAGRGGFAGLSYGPPPRALPAWPDR